MKNIQNNLLADLRTKSGLPLIKGTECRELKNQIELKCKWSPSFDTLRRILGFVKYSSSPNLENLDLLALYLGFNSYPEYISAKNPLIITDGFSFSNMLKLIFGSPLLPELDYNYHLMCHRISQLAYDKPEYLQLIDFDIIKQQPFQLYFVERFPLFDLINHGFNNILEKYLTLKNDPETQLFVQTSLFLHEYKSGKKNLNRISKLININHEDFNPFLKGRHAGLQLFLNSDIGSQKRVFDKVRTQLNDYNAEDRFRYLFTFLDFAITQRLYQLSHRLLQDYSFNEKDRDGWTMWGYNEAFKVYQFTILSYLNRKEEAIQLQEDISIERIAFYFRKNFSLMFLEGALKINNISNSSITKKSIHELKEFLYD